VDAARPVDVVAAEIWALVAPLLLQIDFQAQQGG